MICYKALAADGSGSFSDIGEAIDGIIEEQINSPGPAVAVLSLGSKAGIETTLLDNFVTSLHNSGVIPVVAAGNFIDDACLYTPARAEGAIAVGGTDIMDDVFKRSNYGNCLNFLSPGEGVSSASFTSDDETEVRSGTSMAAPIVAGAIALLLGEDASLEQDDLISLISMNAKSLEYSRDEAYFVTEMVRIGQDDCSLYNFPGQTRLNSKEEEAYTETTMTTAPAPVSITTSMTTPSTRYTTRGLSTHYTATAIPTQYTTTTPPFESSLPRFSSTRPPTNIQSQVTFSTLLEPSQQMKNSIPIQGEVAHEQDRTNTDQDRSNTEKALAGIFSCDCPMLAAMGLCYEKEQNIRPSTTE